MICTWNQCDTDICTDQLAVFTEKIAFAALGLRWWSGLSVMNDDSVDHNT